MRIQHVHSHLLSHAFAQPLKLRYFGGERTILKRDAMLIRVEADNGLVGYGPGEGSETAQKTIREVIGPFLEGRTLADPDALRVQFIESIGQQAGPLRIYCAVELALYDLLGKERGLPVSELLGGRIRDRIRLYGSAGMYMSPEQYAAEAAAIAGLGFRAYKLRSGLGPEEDLAAVRRIRETMGSDFDVMVDAHTWWRMGDRNYSEETVEKLLEPLAAQAIAWLEEPLPPQDHEGYRRLRELDIVPIAAGEHEPNEAGHFDFIAMGGVDYLQMDIVCQGGYPTARRIFPQLAGAGMKFAFHSWGTALEIVAAAQLGVCYPESVVEWLEYPCYATPSSAGMYPFPLASEVLQQPLELDHGDLVVPQSPGWGIEVNEKVVERYPWIPGPWSVFKIDSPAETRSVTSDHSLAWNTSGSGS